MFEISPAEWTAILLSLRVAVIATLVATPFGIALAWLLARYDFWGKSVLDAAVHLPLVLPPVVTGYLLLLTFGRRGLVGAWLADHLGIVFAFRWTGAALACGIMSFPLLVLFGKRGPLGSLLDEWFGIVIAFRWTGAALASAIMAFPLMVRAIRLSIESIDQRLEVAARTLGGSRLWVFASITLPLALPGIITGTLLSFARGLGEFGATITFVSNIPGETQTLPLAIYTFTQVPGGESDALRLSIVAVVLSIVALAASEWLTRRSHRAGAQ